MRTWRGEVTLGWMAALPNIKRSRRSVTESLCSKSKNSMGSGRTYVLSSAISAALILCCALRAFLAHLLEYLRELDALDDLPVDGEEVIKAAGEAPRYLPAAVHYLKALGDSEDGSAHSEREQVWSAHKTS